MKVPIPVVNSGAPDIDQAFDALKQNMDSLTGQQKNASKLLPLPSTATLDDCIKLVNALLARIT